MSVSYQTIKGQAEPLADDILVIAMEQGQRITSSGLILADDTSYGNISEEAAKSARGVRPRWAQVYKVGSNVDYVSPGQYVLMDHGRWTYAIDFVDESNKDIKIQKIDPEGILLVSDSYLGDFYY